MKFNKHTDIRSDFESKLIFSDWANYDYSAKIAVNTLSQRVSESQPYSNAHQSNFFHMKNKDDELANDLRFKDILTKTSKVDDKLVSKKSSASDEINEESWRYNRKWLSTVFMIWFFLAFALLINAIYY